MAPRQIVVLRHAEKPDDPDDPNLSPAGEQRAKMLASLIPRRFPHPDYLFAAAPSKDSNRPVETLTPLATKLGMNLDADIADKDYPKLATDLLNKPKYVDKLVIVCWHHGHIPGLAMAFGVPQPEVAAAPGITDMRWDPTVFDRFWSIAISGSIVTFTTSTQTPAG